ncbi:uncharacterized protein LOC131323595 [Rhododendron vialii]|uniref:uncharacterized protein LOC131323595 n=1 Tax=Rhododendron vialii TaxID=182163 RepID=UPI00265FB757|nr:uncharacterized protein LOC131323595 [Rhododendron vialii]
MAGILALETNTIDAIVILHKLLGKKVSSRDVKKKLPKTKSKPKGLPNKHILDFPTIFFAVQTSPCNQTPSSLRHCALSLSLSLSLRFGLLGENLHHRKLFPIRDQKREHRVKIDGHTTQDGFILSLPLHFLSPPLPNPYSNLALLLSLPLPFLSPSKTPFSLSKTALEREIRVFGFFKRSKNGFSTTSSAVATESTETASVARDNAQEEALVEKIVLPTNESSEKLLRIRHTCAHVMAMAVQKIFPDAKVTIGSWIENGFYYDFDMEPLTDKDLKGIKKEMDRIISRNLPLIREEVSRDQAQKRIMVVNEPYKMEILESIKEDPITIYHIGKVKFWAFLGCVLNFQIGK